MGKNSKEQWDAVYKNENVPPPIQRDMPNFVKMLKKNSLNRVLDLACGSGRHVSYLASKGFDTYGLDISEEGIKKARMFLKQKNLKAHLVVGSMYEMLPYDDDFFDAIMCIRALHHGTIDEIRETISEMERTLKPRGLVYVTVRKKTPKKDKHSHKYIGPRTYIPLEGKEKGVVHYLFNEKSLKKEFDNFEILSLQTDYGPKKWEVYYSLIGKLKNNC